jgi:uncharacterized membrane-anchored protein
VLPTLAQCVTSPSLQGCAVVLPPLDHCVANPADPVCAVVIAPTTADSPVQQVLNTTVNLINASVPLTVPVKADDKAAADKLDKKKDDKKDVVAADKPGVKNDDAVKKMYCN